MAFEPVRPVPLHCVPNHGVHDRVRFPQHMLSTAAGAVISLGTLADIGFNLVFGRATDYFGYGISFMAVPLCMAGFYLAYLRFARRFGARSGQIIWKRG